MPTGFIDIMKRAALDAVATTQYTDLKYGDVISTSPLKVQISNQLTLPESVLVVPKHLTNYQVVVEANWDIPSVSGGNKLTIKNALKVGDRVALLRQQGGQSFYILDKI